MEIIKKKVLEKYNVDEIKNMCAEKFFNNNFKKNTHFCSDLFTFAKYFDINQLSYTIEDFKQDYPEIVLNYKEIETVFSLYKNGKPLKFYERERNYKTGSFINSLRNGFYYNSITLLKMLDLLVITYDISDFKVEYYKEHIELYGEKEKLEEFKSKYDLKERVYFELYKNSWHLATRGLLAEYIRLKENP